MTTKLPLFILSVFLWFTVYIVSYLSPFSTYQLMLCNVGHWLKLCIPFIQFIYYYIHIFIYAYIYILFIYNYLNRRNDMRRGRLITTFQKVCLPVFAFLMLEIFFIFFLLHH